MAGLVSYGMMIAINDATKPILLQVGSELSDGSELC